MVSDDGNGATEKLFCRAFATFFPIHDSEYKEMTKKANIIVALVCNFADEIHDS